MAEIALPLIGLGALYVISNNKNEKENFVDSNKHSTTNFFPPPLGPASVPPQNYPKNNYPIERSNKHSVREYNNPNHL